MCSWFLIPKKNNPVSVYYKVCVMCNWKREEYSNCLFRQLWIVFFDALPKLDKWSFLKCWFQYGILNPVVKLEKNSFTLGSVDLCCTLNGSLPVHHFISLIIGPLGNTSSLENGAIPNVNAFYCAISRHHSC